MNKKHVSILYIVSWKTGNVHIVNNCASSLLHFEHAHKKIKNYLGTNTTLLKKQYQHCVPHTNKDG